MTPSISCALQVVVGTGKSVAVVAEAAVKLAEAVANSD